MARDHTSVQARILNFWKYSGSRPKNKGSYWQVETLRKVNNSTKWDVLYTNDSTFSKEEFYQAEADKRMSSLEGWFPAFVEQVVSSLENNRLTLVPTNDEEEKFYVYLAHILWRQPEQRERLRQMIYRRMIIDSGFLSQSNGSLYIPKGNLVLPVEKSSSNFKELARSIDIVNQKKMERFLSTKWGGMKKTWIFILPGVNTFITGNHPYFLVGEENEGGGETNIREEHSKTDSYYFVIHPRLCIEISEYPPPRLRTLESGLIIYPTYELNDISSWKVSYPDVEKIEKINIGIGASSEVWIVSVERTFLGLKRLLKENPIYGLSNTWAIKGKIP